jgi:hypothetical protein
MLYSIIFELQISQDKTRDKKRFECYQLLVLGALFNKAIKHCDKRPTSQLKITPLIEMTNIVTFHKNRIEGTKIISISHHNNL